MNHSVFLVRLAAVIVALSIVSGCGRRDASSSSAEESASAASSPASGEKGTSFATPEEAVTALVAAAEKHDVGELRRLLGIGSEELVTSGDELVDQSDRDAFVAGYREQHRFVAGGPDSVVLQVGSNDWPLPIPLVREKDGWRFDGPAGIDELVARRVGANELRTINVLRGYVEAQEEYASTAHDGVPAGTYAQRVRSEPGKQNGLYWEAREGEPQSPAGPLLAAAADEGHAPSGGDSYHGYRYRILLAQGPAANGGAHEYLVDDKLTGGFALIAYPETYGVSGVVTFMVNQDGVVWQKDLGDATADAAAAIKQFNPDEEWTPLAPEVDAELVMR